MCRTLLGRAALVFSLLCSISVFGVDIVKEYIRVNGSDVGNKDNILYNSGEKVSMRIKVACNKGNWLDIWRPHITIKLEPISGSVSNIDAYHSSRIAYYDEFGLGDIIYDSSGDPIQSRYRMFEYYVNEVVRDGDTLWAGLDGNFTGKWRVYLRAAVSDENWDVLDMIPSQSSTSYTRDEQGYRCYTFTLEPNTPPPPPPPPPPLPPPTPPPPTFNPTPTLWSIAETGERFDGVDVGERYGFVLPTGGEYDVILMIRNGTPFDVVGYNLDGQSGQCFAVRLDDKGAGNYTFSGVKPGVYTWECVSGNVHSMLYRVDVSDNFLNYVNDGGGVVSILGQVRLGTSSAPIASVPVEEHRLSSFFYGITVYYDCADTNYKWCEVGSYTQDAIPFVCAAGGGVGGTFFVPGLGTLAGASGGYVACDGVMDVVKVASNFYVGIYRSVSGKPGAASAFGMSAFSFFIAIIGGFGFEDRVAKEASKGSSSFFSRFIRPIKVGEGRLAGTSAKRVLETAQTRFINITKYTKEWAAMELTLLREGGLKGLREKAKNNLKVDGRLASDVLGEAREFIMDVNWLARGGEIKYNSKKLWTWKTPDDRIRLGLEKPTVPGDWIRGVAGAGDIDRVYLTPDGKRVGVLVGRGETKVFDASNDVMKAENYKEFLDEGPFEASIIETEFIFRASGGSVDEEITITVSAPNNPPVILSGPTADLDIITANAAVGFNVTVIDPDGDPLRCEWNFGDGYIYNLPVTGAGVSHTFMLPGTYVVSFTVSDGVASVSDQITITVGARRYVNVINLAMRLNFALAQRDRCYIRGWFPVEQLGTLDGMTVLLDIGGACQRFVLSGRGCSRTASGCFSLRISGNRCQFAARLWKGSWGSVWSATGLRNADVRTMVTVPVRLVLGSGGQRQDFFADKEVRYSARVGQWGQGRVRY